MKTFYMDCLSATNDAAGWWCEHRHHRWRVLIGADRFMNFQWAVVDDFGILTPSGNPHEPRID